MILVSFIITKILFHQEDNKAERVLEGANAKKVRACQRHIQTTSVVSTTLELVCTCWYQWTE